MNPATIITTNNSLQVIQTLGIVVGIGIYLFVFARQGSQKATDEQAVIYENLNRALKEQVGVLEKKLDKAVTNIKLLDARISKLTLDVSNYESLIVRSLREYWDNHPKEARALQKAKEVKQ